MVGTDRGFPADSTVEGSSYLNSNDPLRVPDASEKDWHRESQGEGEQEEKSAVEKVRGGKSSISTRNGRPGDPRKASPLCRVAGPNNCWPI